jgi:glycosyltransferase involved in cell wall biosynthesis
LIYYAEDLMAAQVARGDSVSYFCSGRHYPFVAGPRLKRWRRDGVEMHEVINPPITPALEAGTRHPEKDLSEPQIEAVFKRVLAQTRPDVVHIQELFALPSSVIDIAREARVPVVMTLQDYFPLCSTLRLYDRHGQICMRREVGVECAANNANAPPDSGWMLALTIDFEIARLCRRVGVRPITETLPLDAIIHRVASRVARRASQNGSAERHEPTLAAAFQRRRELNVERLSRVDRLIAPSDRVAEIYRTLGVAGDRLSKVRFTLANITRLRQRVLTSPPSPVTFGTLNGFASTSKGARTLLAALRALRASGDEDRLRFRVFGYVDPAIRQELTSYRCVDIHGRYGRGEVDRLLDGVDVGIMPSMWEECYPFVGLEYIAKGIPLIVNPLGGMVEYAREGETAWLNHGCSGDGIAAIMSRLAREPQLVLDMHRRMPPVRDEVVLPMHGHADTMDGVYQELIA